MKTTVEPTIAELAAKSMAAVRVFEKLGIDYCCGGKRSLEDVCREKGLKAGDVERQLEAASQTGGDSTDWAAAPLSALIRHIVTRHHGFLRREFPALSERLAKVQMAHGERDGEMLARLEASFRALRTELMSHMDKEEAVLFPAIDRFERAGSGGEKLPGPCFGSVQMPILVMEQEHELAGAELARIRELTSDFRVPEYACNTYRALLEGLRELEEDLHVHIHLENNILFPRALMAEQAGQ